MELIKLRAAYPYPDRSVEEMRVLADVWMEDFERVTDEALQASIKEHRRKSQFWPTVAELMDRASWETRIRPHKELPEPEGFNEEVTAGNLIRVKALVNEVFKGI